MVSHQDLARLTVERIIFHDVPIASKVDSVKPTLTDRETKKDAKRVSILEKRLRGVFGGGAAYAIQFQNDTRSPVPESVRALTEKSPTEELFVDTSRKMAQFLFDLQTGTMSPGLLCALKVSAGPKYGVAIMKLEREEGADLRLNKDSGHSSFEMSVLDSLVLTDGTRLFKSALFIREDSESFAAVACDSQSNPNTSADVARFWLKFLGCDFVIDPRISTQQWFDTSVRFVNERVIDPIVKNSLYEHLVSEMNSNKATVSPKKFITEYVARDLRQSYADFLDEKGIPLQNFQKNTADIDAKLKRLSYQTEQGVMVTVPAEKEELVEVGSKRIIVKDSLKKVSRR